MTSRTPAHLPEGPASHAGTLQAEFLATILPAVERYSQFYFRHLRCSDRKAEAIAEAVALAWKWYLRLAQRGKDAKQFPWPLASFAARAVSSGRRLISQERPKDVLSRVAQRRHGFTVNSLPSYSTLTTNPLAEALADNTQTPPPDQAAFRIDFPAWLGSLGARNRNIAEDMAVGHRTQDLAGKYGISQARVSQLRQAFCQDWRRFTGDSKPGAG